MNACEFLAPHLYLISKYYDTLVNTELSGNAHLVAGGTEMVEHILKTLSAAGIETRGNPDIFIREYLQFGVDDARDVRERASSRALKESGRMFIIVAAQMTSEAQNALLKTLEEPSSNAL